MGRLLGTGRGRQPRLFPYTVVGEVRTPPTTTEPTDAGGLPQVHEWSRAALPLPDRPAIAVLPFINMSGDSEQEYFSDGISEDIITALSKLRWFFVIARNSSFIYKGKAVHMKQIAEELGVGYVVEGSVRKGGDRVRITAQLNDVATGSHIWAEHYDRSLADVHDDTCAVDDGASVGIAHPLHLGASVAAWSELFADYEILQPFPQLGREVHTLTAEEREVTAYLPWVRRASHVGRYGWVTAAVTDEETLDAALEWLRESYWLKAPTDVRDAALR